MLQRKLINMWTFLLDVFYRSLSRGLGFCMPFKNIRPTLRMALAALDPSHDLDRPLTCGGMWWLPAWWVSLFLNSQPTWLERSTSLMEDGVSEVSEPFLSNNYFKSLFEGVLQLCIQTMNNIIIILQIPQRYDFKLFTYLYLFEAELSI